MQQKDDMVEMMKDEAKAENWLANNHDAYISTMEVFSLKQMLSSWEDWRNCIEGDC